LGDFQGKKQLTLPHRLRYLPLLGKVNFLKKRSHMTIEKHPFGSFAPLNARYLLLGSFPCNRHLRLGDAQPEYGEWFYCGSGKSAFWTIIERVYNRQLPPGARQVKAQLFEEIGMAITDIALEIERKKPDCLDNSLVIKQYNTEAIAKIFRDRQIEKVFFTSRFVETQFIKRIQKHLDTKGFLAEYLISPSPAANKSIMSRVDYQEFIAKYPGKSLTDFRVDYYKERLPKLDYLLQT
jgi:G:T/U-mismatch repair DNA glycosylase